MSTDTVDTKEAIREQVRERYAEAARTVTEGSRGSCGSGSCCDNDPPGAFGEVLYSSEERGSFRMQPHSPAWAAATPPPLPT